MLDIVLRIVKTALCDKVLRFNETMEKLDPFCETSKAFKIFWRHINFAALKTNEV